MTNVADFILVFHAHLALANFKNFYGGGREFGVEIIWRYENINLVWGLPLRDPTPARKGDALSRHTQVHPYTAHTLSHKAAGGHILFTAVERH